MDTMVKFYALTIVVAAISGIIFYLGRRNEKFKERSLWFSLGVLAAIVYLMLMRELINPWLFPETY